jgi:Cytochrome c7 and related cytochrome c
VAAIAIVMLIGATALLLTGQVSAPSRDSGKEVFTSAHSSVYQATRHFFGIRPEPEQPILFVHKVHIEDVQLSCVDCHITVERGPKASIPDIRTCWGCHEETLVDHPEVAKIKFFHDKGQDIPWQRVYGWNDESHVHFNHAPHIRSGIGCVTCHGNVEQMTVASRAVEHSMGFCVKCHQEKQASTDCLTCHY